MKSKILLVDDEVDLPVLFRQRFRQQIQTGQYTFIFAQDGQQALTLLEQQPDNALVLSDINMPGMDGLTLLDRLTQLNPIVRTVMVTAYGDMTNIRTAMNRGAFDFITKPIDFNDLERTIEKTLRYVDQLRQIHELKAVNAMKTRFFVNITHELRTPLSLVISPVDELLNQATLPLPDQQRLVTVRRNARQLLRLIDQLIDINQLEAQQVDMVHEVGDLPGFVTHIVDLFRPSAEIKNLELTYQTDLPTGNYLFDAGKWETILYNLRTNAMRFTEVGGVFITLQQTAQGTRLSVRDTGIGITAHKLPHVFDPFYQGDNQRIRSNDSTGISLALVKALTLRMEGSIQVKSEVDAGTEFIVDLPLQRTSSNGESRSITSSSLLIEPPVLSVAGADRLGDSLADAPPLILVVEDNVELREYMVAELTTTYRVRTAANGHEGWIVAKEELPDLIITDLMIARLDGYALIERLKTDPSTDHIATILLTASADEESRLKGLTVGADDYLTKPFNLGELRLRLRNLLGRQQRLRDYYRQQLAQPDSATSLQPIADQFLRRLYQLIEQRLDDSTLSVEWLADELAMSRKALYLKAHNLTHLSPIELIRQYRLRKAIDLLRAGHSASETAYMVGFDSPSYFTKVFREFYQQTPSAYTKK